MDKIKKIKILSAVSIIGAILAITVAFAPMTRSMVINGSGNVKPALWDIHFKDISEPTITGGASVITEPTVTDKGAKIDNLEVRLTLPQDKVEYTVYIENSGDMNAKIDDIKYPTLTEEESKIFKFSAKYEKDGTPMQVGDTLYKGQTKKVIITIEYLDISDKNLLPKEIKTINIDFRLLYVQDNTIYTTNKTEREFNVGDLFCLNDKNECFYTISDNGLTVTALSRYNISTQTYIQSSSYQRKGLAFANTNYWNVGSYPNNFVFNSNSILWDILVNYKNYLENDLNKNIADITIISKQQLASLGCDLNCKNESNPSPTWVYSTWYWTGTYASSNQIYCVDQNSTLHAAGFRSGAGGDFGYGLRPVITISKEEID